MKNNLSQFRVQKPCPKNWDEMIGDEKKRFCDHCNLHVHNISTMSDGERTALTQNAGRLCVAYFQRNDGSIVTRSWMDSLTNSFRGISSLAASVMALVFPLALVGCDDRSTSQTLGEPLASPQAICTNS